MQNPLEVLEFKEDYWKRQYKIPFAVRMVLFWAYVIFCLALVISLLVRSLRLSVLSSAWPFVILILGGLMVYLTRPVLTPLQSNVKLSFFDTYLELMQYAIDDGNIPKGGQALNMYWRISYQDIDALTCSLSGILHRCSIRSDKRVVKHISYPVTQPFGEGGRIKTMMFISLRCFFGLKQTRPILRICCWPSWNSILENKCKLPLGVEMQNPLETIEFKEDYWKVDYKIPFVLRMCILWGYILFCVVMLVCLVVRSLRTLVFAGTWPYIVLILGAGLVYITRSGKSAQQANVKLSFFDDHLELMQYNINHGNLPKNGGELNILWTIPYQDVDSLNCSFAGELHNFNLRSDKKVVKTISYPPNRTFGEGPPHLEYDGYIVTIFMRPETNSPEFEDLLIAKLEQYTGKKMQVTSGR